VTPLPFSAVRARALYWPAIGAGLLFLLVRLPFFWTRAVQEDAFISFRCARNFADTGVYGFNAGERVSAATSHAYVFLLALLRKAFGGQLIGHVIGVDDFIVAALVANTLMLVVGSWALARSLGRNE
jgi:hypothetical protein